MHFQLRCRFFRVTHKTEVTFLFVTSRQSNLRDFPPRRILPVNWYCFAWRHTVGLSAFGRDTRIT